ncbi:alpha/beta hydrolase [Gordonia sp. DT219]|uniref:alpha/beta hydrolase n=1 Tax=Gordonia sp. DT219 TaxID=3416658 RepID=UPI003CF6344A
MSAVLNLSIIHGWVPIAMLVAGAAGLIWLVARRSVRYLVIVVPLTVVTTVIVIAVARWYIEDVWRRFPEAIPLSVYVWAGVALLGILLAIPRLFTRAVPLGHRAITVIAAVLVVLLGLTFINVHFASYPTLRAALGLDHVESVDLNGVPRGSTVPLAKWSAPQGLPERGRVASAAIPGSASHFDARPAEVYLPPAYFAQPRPLLPVLVLLAGQPGSPSDWLTSVQMVGTLDDFAAHHHGVTPVVIVADGTGTELDNPLCMDSRLGNAATYLTADVAAWAKTNLQVEQPRDKWAVGGLSYGGTCALQLAVNYPDMYPTFLDMSGQYEPTLGDRRTTVQAAFGGDQGRFEGVNPVDLLRRKQYPNVSGVFLVGADDGQYRPGLEKVYTLARGAGMNVRFTTVPGGHSFGVWSQGFAAQLPWLANRLGVTA